MQNKAPIAVNQKFLMKHSRGEQMRVLQTMWQNTSSVISITSVRFGRAQRLRGLEKLRTNWWRFWKDQHCTAATASRKHYVPRFFFFFFDATSLRSDWAGTRPFCEYDCQSSFSAVFTVTVPTVHLQIKCRVNAVPTLHTVNKIKWQH